MPHLDYHGDVVVFDLDDTLMRERDFVRSGFRIIENMLTERFGDSFYGVAADMTALLEKRENYFAFLEERMSRNDAVGGEDAVRSLMKECVDAYRSHHPESLPFADSAREVVNALHDRRIVMAIVTDGRSVTQRRKIEALGLDSLIDPEDILISEETGSDKTKPDNFQQIVRRYPEAHSFIYIADNERKDFLMPNLLGWQTFKVLYNSDNVHEDYENTDILQHPMHLLSSISEIFDKIKLIGR